MSSSRRPSFFHLSTWLPLPALALAALLAALPAHAATRKQELTPRDFSTLIPIETRGNAPVYRLDLPFLVYERSRLSPLRDVRVFNRLGQAEAICINAVESLPEPAREHAFPCFSLRVRVSPDGVALLRDGRDAPASGPGRDKNEEYETRGLLVDFDQKRPRFDRVRLVPGETLSNSAAGPDGQRGSMLSTRLYVSRDLQHWSLAARPSLGRLRVDGQSLEMLELPVGELDQRYMLLVPAAGSELFPVRELLAREKAKNATPVQSVRLHGRKDDKAGGFGYTVPRGLPVLSLEPELDSDNVLLRGRILTPALLERRNARHQIARRQNETELVWEERAPLFYYRLGGNGRDLRHSDPVPFDRNWLGPENNAPLLRDAPFTLLLRLRGDRAEAPALLVRWARQQLYFMAGGPGPYILAVGSLKAEEAADTRDAALRELPVQAAPARLEMDKLHAQTPPTAYAETSGGRRLLLWGVLLLGAACMAFMAVQLLRKPKE